MGALIDLQFRRHAQDIAATWQARALAGATNKLGAVVLSVLAHNFDDEMPVLLRVVYPGFTSIALPFLTTAGKIAKTGHICADLATKDGIIIKMFALFRDKRQMEGAFRGLADKLKFTDDERRALFAAVQKWVVCDYRLDPTMDPRDPDAARLTIN